MQQFKLKVGCTGTSKNQGKHKICPAVGDRWCISPMKYNTFHVTGVKENESFELTKKNLVIVTFLGEVYSRYGTKFQ